MYLKNIKKVFFGLIASGLILSPAMAQTDEKTSPFKVSADLVSNYVWRGSMATGSPTPNFQPTLAFTKGGFEIGVWGSTDFAGSYKEVDPYVSVSVKQFKFTFTDYNWNFGKANYFDYKNSETGHMLEGSIGYNGKESFPISFSWNTIFYGFDKKHTEDTTKQAYSTYIEVGYSKGMAGFFFGVSPWESYYTAYRKGFEVVNVGAAISKNIKVSESFLLPVKATLVINPSGGYTRNDYIHLVFGVTFQ